MAVTSPRFPASIWEVTIASNFSRSLRAFAVGEGDGWGFFSAPRSQLGYETE